MRQFYKGILFLDSKKDENMKNVFTIDTEEWYHANFKDGLFTDDGSMPSRVEAEVDRYLELFEIYHVRATFFILGSVAGRHPDMIAKIAKQGHEIASHGYGHLLVYEQTEQEFREDVYKSKAVLEDLTGVEGAGYSGGSGISVYVKHISDQKLFIWNSPRSAIYTRMRDLRQERTENSEYSAFHNQNGKTETDSAVFRRRIFQAFSGRMHCIFYRPY